VIGQGASKSYPRVVNGSKAAEAEGADVVMALRAGMAGGRKQ
jgi:hypothetical protein